MFPTMNKYPGFFKVPTLMILFNQLVITQGEVIMANIKIPRYNPATLHWTDLF